MHCSKGLASKARWYEDVVAALKEEAYPDSDIKDVDH